MRHNNEDELMEIADDDGRDELVAEITALYERNTINPTLISIELEKTLRVYLETADLLLDAPSEIGEGEIEAKLDELDGLIAQLRIAEEGERLSATNTEGEIRDTFVIPGNNTVH